MNCAEGFSLPRECRFKRNWRHKGRVTSQAFSLFRAARRGGKSCPHSLPTWRAGSVSTLGPWTFSHPSHQPQCCEASPGGFLQRRKRGPKCNPGLFPPKQTGLGRSPWTHHYLHAPPFSWQAECQGQSCPQGPGGHTRSGGLLSSSTCLVSPLWVWAIWVEDCRPRTAHGSVSPSPLTCIPSSIFSLPSSPQSPSFLLIFYGKSYTFHFAFNKFFPPPFSSTI